MRNATAIGVMEPMLPDQSNDLEDAAVELIAASSRFASRLNPVLQATIGDLVRSMNCYYSNLIENHNTELADIERALSGDYSANPEKRDLQLEARAHIAVQHKIDHGAMPYSAASREGVRWIHREFCSQLPEDLLIVYGQDETETLTPGAFRTRHVAVGNFVPPDPEAIDDLMGRFEQAYAGKMLGKLQKIIAVGAAHHRLTWIHPFLDGNGRVARLVSHAMYRDLGIGSELWSVARGLSRTVDRYKALLANADRERQGDRDGRGNLSEAGLSQFSRYFMDTAIDQVNFMEGLLNLEGLLERVENWTRSEVAAKRLPNGSFRLLREAILIGEFPRGASIELTGYQERQARSVLSALIARGLLLSDDARGPVRLGVPSEVVERWFPSLYQPAIREPAYSLPSQEDEDWPPSPSP